MEALWQKYLDPRHPGSLGGVERLRRVHDGDEDREKIQRALQHVDTYTIGKPVRPKFKRNRIIVTNLQQQYQADLADMSKYAEQHDGIRHLLAVVDCFSKRALVQPLLTKVGVRVKAALQQVFKELGVPEKLQVDKSSEFYNEVIKTFLVEKDVVLFSTENNDIKCSMVERLIRIPKTRIFQCFRSIYATRYIDRLPDFVYAYNHSVHSAHGKNRTVQQKNSLSVFNALYGKMLQEKSKVPRYKVGDFDRISTNKLQFEEGYEDNFQPDIYEITKVKRHTVPVYELKNPNSNKAIKGQFYEPELSLVRDYMNWTYQIQKVLQRPTRNRRREKLVRWLGYGPESDSWIPA
ncbi:hypothetical protein RvY_16138 [Ramazzottius varieornatus]|uniref:Integrase catalytic domain-containing protein n=1 Tax=Ramazzottius varieornatus TaxID=947166 RepID=A0A1D1VYT2_RAMVA|nr:hypothetical protein RvY_16138 [Ramazzottius varieornatus]